MPRRIPFFILDSFTETPFAGNPAGVFFDDAGALTAEEMQRMAGEVSLESAFVSPADEEGAAFRLRYFTSACEVPLCGHATVAALTALHHARRVGEEATLILQTKVGALPISLTAREGGVAMTLFQTPVEFGPPMTSIDEISAIADALGCPPDDLCIVVAQGEEYAPRRVSTGTPWLLVPLTAVEFVKFLEVNMDAVTRLSSEQNTLGIYVFAHGRHGEWDSFDIWSRCFAPIAGLNEDPVTGSGAGALGLYLHRAGVLTPGDTLTVQQGMGGGRGGTATVSLAMNEHSGALEAVAVSGTAVLVAEGMFVM